MSKQVAIKNLADHLTTRTCGILWFTEQNLLERPLPFNELDYFLDGLLTNICLQENKSNVRKHFLSTTHFGKPFFLAQFQLGADNKSLAPDLHEVGQLALKLRGERGHLVVIGDHLERAKSALKVFTKDFELEYISI